MNEYFKDETSKIIFFLVELEGKQQLDFLGINSGHYCNRDIAEKWYKGIESIINPKRCSHPKAAEAMQELKNIYKRMKK